MTDKWGPPITVYTKEQAVEDGQQALLMRVGGVPVYITSTLLYDDGYEDEDQRNQLVKQGLDKLKQPDPEDTPYMKLRVLEEGKVWVIQATDGITFMKPEDY